MLKNEKYVSKKILSRESGLPEQLLNKEEEN